MSLMRCEYHDRPWDSDTMENCPRCDDESERSKADAWNEWCDNKNKEAREEKDWIDPRELEYWERFEP